MPAVLIIRVSENSTGLLEISEECGIEEPCTKKEWEAHRKLVELFEKVLTDSQPKEQFIESNQDNLPEFIRKGRRS